MKFDVETDVLVIGSGAGGLTTAIVAKLNGLDTIIVEKAPFFGGTTAWSGGIAWVPCNSHQKAAGIADSIELARDYVRHEAGTLYDRDRVDAFLENAPRMVDLLEARTCVRFELSAEPDYHQHVAGALEHGRALRPLDFDARKLGRQHRGLRPPPRQRVLFLGLQIGGAHLKHFMNATRSWTSLAFVLRRVLGHMGGLVTHGRAMHPTMGNALAASLAASAFDLGIPILLSSPAQRLLVQNDAVAGAVVARAGTEVRIAARRGVVLACGGFPHDYARRRQTFPHHPAEREHLSNTPDTNTGDGIKLGESVGGVFDDGFADPATWYPTSRVRYPDGTEGNNAHLLERGKPGFIAVTAGGKRFANEATNYHDFVKAMLRASVGGEAPYAFYVCDHRAFRRYGMGAVKPWPMPYRGYLRTGYLMRGATVEVLASDAGIDPHELGATIARYNANAREGRDPEFSNGENAYDVSQGDPRHTPNPCLAPIETPPFYAVRIVPGDLGTLAGLRTDRLARVLDVNGKPIVGLYAVGNDQASVFGGSYPGGGATISPAMTFGYVVGMELARTPG